MPTAEKPARKRKPIVPEIVAVNGRGCREAADRASSVQRLPDPALFVGNVLEASTESSIVGEDLDGNIQLWNAGARRLYGYEPEEVIGKANSSILHTPEDVASSMPLQMMAAALEIG